MLELVLFAVGIAIAIGVVNAVLALTLSSFWRWLCPSANAGFIALISSGLFPLLIAVWSLVSILSVGDDFSGPVAQGMAIVTVIACVLVLIIWPITFRLAVRYLTTGIQ